MREDIDEDKRLTDYLLGKLPPSEEARLEEEYLADGAAQDRLLVIEDELVDSYLEGVLSDADRQHLEARFLSSPRGRHKLELARALTTCAADAHEARRRTLRPAFIRWAIAAVLALASLFAGSILRDQPPPRAPQVADRGPSAIGAPSPSAATHAASPAAAPAETRTPRGGGGGLLAVTLVPMSRSIDTSRVVRIPPGGGNIRVALDVEAGSHESYRVALHGARDEVKWSARHLVTRATPSGPAIVLDLPTALFANGEHVFVLTSDEERPAPIASYGLTIRNDPPEASGAAVPRD